MRLDSPPEMMVRSPSYTEKAAPDAKIATAASNDQKNRSLP